MTRAQTLKLINKNKKRESKLEITTSVELIKAIITLSRLLDQSLDYDNMTCGERNDKYQPIRDALLDLKTCADFQRLIGYYDDEAMRIIHEAAERLKSDGRG